MAGLCNGGPEGVASSGGRRGHGKSPKIEKYEERAADRRKDLSPAGAGVFCGFREGSDGAVFLPGKR
ncbi:MAG: hypothetical protein CW346_07785 [Bacillaceae bacterium]|nr:hypothetical protein [Bacillaceae bacterium]